MTEGANKFDLNHIRRLGESNHQRYAASIFPVVPQSLGSDGELGERGINPIHIADADATPLSSRVASAVHM